MIQTPWRIWNFGESMLCWPIVWLQFALNGIAWGEHWRFYGTPIVQKHTQSTMQFGRGLQLRSSRNSNPLGPNHPVILSTREKDAKLTVGDNFGMTGGTLCAALSITIGNNVRVGANTNIIDTDFHPLEMTSPLGIPKQARIAPVVIEDGVFIGMNSLILKGVTIGHDSVIGAGSVVSRSIPAGVIAAGNPAKIVREL